MYLKFSNFRGRTSAGGGTSLGPKTGTSVRWGGNWQNFRRMGGDPPSPPQGKNPDVATQRNLDVVICHWVYQPFVLYACLLFACICTNCIWFSCSHFKTLTIDFVITIISLQINIIENSLLIHTGVLLSSYYMGTIRTNFDLIHLLIINSFALCFVCFVTVQIILFILTFCVFISSCFVSFLFFSSLSFWIHKFLSLNLL